MPVVMVTAAEHPAGVDLLGGVADAIAGALGLGDGDVIAMGAAPSAVAVSGRGGRGGAGRGWIVVSIRGSDRGPVATRAARAAAQSAAADWGMRHDVAVEGVWTEWIPPEPTW